MQVGHDIPMADHLGVAKTRKLILHRYTIGLAYLKISRVIADLVKSVKRIEEVTGLCESRKNSNATH
jgi:hypothetical protein